MQDAVRDRRLANGAATDCSSTVGLSVRLPNGGVVRVDAAIGQSIASVLVAHGVPLRRAVASGAAGPDCGLGVGRLPAQMGGETTVRPEHDGLEITLDAACVEPQTYWTAG